jgi:hypothetical protein
MSKEFTTFTYRVKLPDPPIISPTMDEKYNYRYVVELMEKTKCQADLPEKNFYYFNYNYYHRLSPLINSLTAIIIIMSYRKFRYYKNNTLVKSILKTTLCAIPILFLQQSYLEMTKSLYHEFVKEILNTDDEKQINEFNEYKNKIRY